MCFTLGDIGIVILAIIRVTLAFGVHYVMVIYLVILTEPDYSLISQFFLSFIGLLGIIWYFIELMVVIIIGRLVLLTVHLIIHIQFRRIYFINVCSNCFWILKWRLLLSLKGLKFSKSLFLLISGLVIMF